MCCSYKNTKGFMNQSKHSAFASLSALKKFIESRSDVLLTVFEAETNPERPRKCSGGGAFRVVGCVTLLTLVVRCAFCALCAVLVRSRNGERSDANVITIIYRSCRWTLFCFRQSVSTNQRRCICFAEQRCETLIFSV